MAEKTISIYDRLIAVQKSLKDPSPDGTGRTGSGGSRQYGYATLANVLGIVRPACNDQGLFLSQRIGGKKDDMHIITSVACGSERLILDSFPLTYVADSQKFGSAVTYAKRYSLISVFGIASKDEDDDGSANSNQPQRMTKQPTKQPAKQTAKQTAKQPDKKPPSPEKKALYDAAQKLTKAIADYAKATGGDAEAIHCNVRERRDFENSTEFYLSVASEFEQETKNCEERMEF